MTVDVAKEYRERVITYRTDLLSYFNTRRDLLPGSPGIPMLRELSERLSREYNQFIAGEFPKGFLAKLAGVSLKVNSMAKKEANDKKAVEELEKMVSELS